MGMLYLYFYMKINNVKFYTIKRLDILRYGLADVENRTFVTVVLDGAEFSD
jgi:hypothetical protein